MVVNMGTYWSIPNDDDEDVEQQEEDLEKHPRPMGRTNVRGRGERGQ